MTDVVKEPCPDAVANGTDAMANDTGRLPHAVRRDSSSKHLNRQFKRIKLTV